MGKKRSNKSRQKRSVQTIIAQPEKKSNPLNYYLLLAGILVLTGIIYSNSISNNFANWDDDIYIVNNYGIRDLSGEGMHKIFTTYCNANYHPLTMLTYALEYKFFGLNPKPYHIINLLLHLLNIILVYYLFYALMSKHYIALLAALLFAIHPMHVESVSWIAELKDVLYAFFFLGSLLTYLLYLKNRKWQYLLYTGLFFLLSLFSKSMAVTLPVLMILIDYYFKRKFTLKTVFEKLPFFALSIVFGILAIYSQQSAGAISDITPVFPVWQRIFLVSYAVLFYIIRLFLPFELSALHYYPLGGALPAVYYLALIGILILAFVIFKSGSLKRDLIFGFLWFLISISLVLQILPVGQAIVAERYTYLPYLGFFFIIATLLDRVPQKNKYLSITTVAVFCMMFSVQTYARNKVWKNGTILFTDVIKKSPDVFYGYFVRGSVFNNDNKNEEALSDFNRCLELRPDFGEGYTSRCYVRYKLGDYAGAMSDGESAVKYNASSAYAWNNCGLAKYANNKLNEAVADYNKSIQLNPEFAEPYNNRGVVKFRKDQLDDAIVDYNTALKIKPDYSDALNNRGVIKGIKKDYEGSIKDFNQALHINPKLVDAYVNRGLSKLNLKMTEDACEDWNKASDLGSGHARQLIQDNCGKK